MEKFLSIENIGISFPTKNGRLPVLEEIDLTVQKGECVSIVGHSGCGKSTLLGIIAGLQSATTGGIILDGTEVRQPGPDRAMVFQNHSLLPWMTVYGNVRLAVNKVFGKTKSKSERDEITLKHLELVHMENDKDKYPREISGGMKQRVGIARALAINPKVLLMDEPFGALDALTRGSLQDSLMEIHAEEGTTIVLITHDVDEAVILSDRIVMMGRGPGAKIEQIIDTELPRPRSRMALAENDRFIHVRAEVLRFLYDTHSNGNGTHGKN